MHKPVSLSWHTRVSVVLFLELIFSPKRTQKQPGGEGPQSLRPKGVWGKKRTKISRGMQLKRFGYPTMKLMTANYFSSICLSGLRIIYDVKSAKLVNMCLLAAFRRCAHSGMAVGSGKKDMFVFFVFFCFALPQNVFGNGKRSIRLFLPFPCFFLFFSCFCTPKTLLETAKKRKCNGFCFSSLFCRFIIIIFSTRTHSIPQKNNK